MAKRRKRQWKGQDTPLRQAYNPGATTEDRSSTKPFPSCPATCGRRTKRSALFPRWTPWVVTLGTFAIRVNHVIDPGNWWVLHPDEIYQSMEVAHSELFGYGHRPYEFIPPPKGDNLSHYQLRELTLGMNALRSPIMAQYMVLVMWLVYSTGLGISNPYLIFRLSQAAITSLLPVAVSRFAEVTCGCPDVATIAAILTGSSAYLSTLGSHTLINSFVSPAIFIGLAQAVRVLQAHHEKSVSTFSNAGPEPDRVGLQLKEKATLSGEPKMKENPQYEEVYDPIDLCHGESQKKRKDKHFEYADVENYYAKKNGDLAEQVSLETSKADMNSHHLQEYSFTTGDPNPHRVSVLSNVSCGIILSVAVYVRPDASLLVGLALLGNHRISGTVSLLRARSAWLLALSGVLGLVLAAANDTVFYGSPILTPLNWARLNVFSNTATTLFGVSGWYFYLHRVFLRDYSMCVASVVFVAAAFISFCEWVVLQHGNKLSSCKIPYVGEMVYRQPTELPIFTHRSLRVHISCVAIPTAIFTCMGHKEERFLHDVVVLFLVAVSQVFLQVVDFVLNKLIYLTHRISRRSWNHNNVDQSEGRGRETAHLLLVFLLSTLFVSYNIHIFGASFDNQRKQWHKLSASSDLDTTMCMHYLSKQSDVSGVFIDRNIKDTAGYSILHKDVPLLYLLGNDFVEFTNASLIKVARSCVIGAQVASMDGINSVYLRNHKNIDGELGTMDNSQMDSYADQNASSKGVWGSTNFRNNGNESKTYNGRNDGDGLNTKQNINPCEVGFFSLNMISDLIHKDNVVALLRKIIGVPSSTRQDQHNPQHQQQHQQHQHHYQQQQTQRPIHQYNYAIVQADKPFLSPAFRPVHRTATMWVWRRVNTPQTEARLRTTLHQIHKNTKTRRPSGARDRAAPVHGGSEGMVRSQPQGAWVKSNAPRTGEYDAKEGRTLQTNNNATKTGKGNESIDVNDYITNSATMMEYEGETLKQLGNYWAAMTRFEAIAMTSRGHDLQGKVEVSVLASMVFCLHRLGEKNRMQAVLDECVTSNSRDQCLDGWRSKVSKLASKLKS
ncbi:hypothetical protein RRG08_020142 [Elysia crispata]|uniref:Mannosyltransferase n=1 Tax=Elysia crispata TaxID=231223 RepID=A0AAE1B1R8_9GAST|nr:hypothetical protein RRG08_020142 [Elysia crispata]